MMTEIFTRQYSPPPVSQNEALQYARCPENHPETLALLRACQEEMQNQLQCSVCYCMLPVKAAPGLCDFSFFTAHSHSLAQHLQSADAALVFAATLGIGPDRLLARATRLSPAKALMLQALGTAQIEALCRQFCRDMETELGMRLLPRFSPGYGDLSLDIQRDIFRLLCCERKIGLTLSESLMMLPTKSVTAFVGIAGKG